MLKKRWLSGLACILSIVVLISTTPMAQVAASSTNTTSTVVVDDFSTYTDTAALASAYVPNANGDPNSVELVASPFETGGNAMKFTYNLGTGYYTGTIHQLSSVQDWTGAQTLNLWFKGDGKNQTYSLQIADGDLFANANHTFECKLNDLSSFDPTSTDPQYLQIPISSFIPKVSGSTLNLANITAINFYVGENGSVSSSSLIIGDINVTTAPTTNTVNVDDFTAYADTTALASAYTANANGDPNSVELVASPFETGGNAMKFTYSLGSQWYTGIIHQFTSAQDWTGAQTLNLWFKGDGKSQTYSIQIADGDLYANANHTFECKLNDLTSFDATSTEPQYLQIPISNFIPKVSGSTLNLTNMTAITFYVGENGSAAPTSSLMIGDINVTTSTSSTAPTDPTNPTEPTAPTVTVTSNNMEANGVGNMLQVLKNNCSISENGRISSFSYTSHNTDILSNASGFSPKGILLKNGTANITIQQVQVFANNKIYTLDVNKDIQVTVSNLPAATTVLNYLNSIKGKQTLTDMHNREPNANPAQATDAVYAKTGVTPAIWSGDFLFKKEDVAARQTMINEAIKQWNNGALVQLMMHVAPPTMTPDQELNGCGWNGDNGSQTSVQCTLTDAQWTDLIANGGTLNTNWKKRLDVYASYLQQLKDAGVTVIFRPFHEMNQYVFWWAGRPGTNGSAALYRLTHDYLVDVKGLNNIIWEWDMQDLGSNYATSKGYDATDWSLFNPGDSYWDIFAFDVYENGYSNPAFYNEAKTIAGNKPMTIGECYTMPSQSVLKSEPNWIYAMPWAEDSFGYNSDDAIRTFYQSNLSIADTPRFVNLTSSDNNNNGNNGENNTGGSTGSSTSSNTGSSTSSSNNQQTDTVTFTGRLIDANGNPIANQMVVLHSSPMVTTTDSKGYFTFSNVPVGEHVLYVEDKAGNILAQTTLTLQTGGTVSVNGTTITATGAGNNQCIVFEMKGSAITPKSIVVNPNTGNDTQNSSAIDYMLSALILLALLISRIIGYRIKKSNVLHSLS